MQDDDFTTLDDLTDADVPNRLLKYAQDLNQTEAAMTLKEFIDNKKTETDKLQQVITDLHYLVEGKFEKVPDESGEINNYVLDEYWQSLEDDLARLGSSL